MKEKRPREIIYPMSGAKEEYRGVSKTLSEWSIETGISEKTLRGRFAKSDDVHWCLFSEFRKQRNGEKYTNTKRAARPFRPKITALCKPLHEIMNYPRECFSPLRPRQF